MISSIGDEEVLPKINYMEEFVKNKLPKLLNKSEEGACAFFYGPYSNDISSFEFNEGERILWRVVVQHVKEMVRTKGLKYFQGKFKGKSAWPNGLMRSPYGQIYGNHTFDGGASALHSKNEEIDVMALKKQLLAKANGCIVKYRQKLLRSRQKLTLDSVVVNIYENGIKGTIKCCYCDERKDQGKDSVKVYCQNIGDKQYWIPSNFEKHLLKYHSSTNEPSTHHDSIIESVVTDFQKNGAKSDDLKHEFDHEITRTESNTSSIEYGISHDISSLIELEVQPFNIEEVETADMENKLAIQLSKQNLQMMNTTFANNENVKEFVSIIDSASKVKVCDIKADDSCLFGSIVHQLNLVKINSKQHADLARTLRKNVVKYIVEHLSDFIFLLKNRLPDGQAEDDDLQTQCLDFVTNELSSLKCWGGCESLKAISELYSVNIIILNDDGKCNFSQSYHPCNDRTISIAFCNTIGGVQQSNINRNHYNSVVEIDDPVMNVMVARLVEGEIKRMKFLKSIEACRTIVLE